MAVRAITIIVPALLLSALVVRNALVDAYGPRDPAKAAAFWPGHPSLVLAAGLEEVGAAAASGRPVNPATVRHMLATSAKVPLAPEPFLVLGVEAQVAGDEALARRAFLAARRRDPRSIAARYFLADHYLRSEQIAQGITEISALTRLVPQSLDAIAPHLAAFARMPGGLKPIRTLLRDEPQLEPLLLNQLAADSRDLSLALSLWSGRTGVSEKSWQTRLLNTLVEAGRYQEARAAWSRFSPGASPPGELDSGFRADALPPFGWTFASGPAGVAEPEGAGRLHILYYGRDNMVLASQLLMLQPGHHRLAMQIGGLSPSARSLAWRLRCLRDSRSLALLDLTSAKRGILVMDFIVPAQGCEAQSLELAGTAPELPEQADLTIADLRLVRSGQ
jgi:hypothetical protein